MRASKLVPPNEFGLPYLVTFNRNTRRHGHGQFTTQHLSFIGVYDEDVMEEGLYTVNSTFSYEGR